MIKNLDNMKEYSRNRKTVKKRRSIGIVRRVVKMDKRIWKEEKLNIIKMK